MAKDSRRWTERKIHEEGDLLGRFNDKSIPDLMRTAVSAIQRLRDHGREICTDGSDEDEKWRKSCHDLWDFLGTVDTRRHQGEELKDVLREFVHLFEHSEFRIQQLLFEVVGNQADNEYRARVARWLAFTYRACTYAILAVWFDYKRETTRFRIDVSLSSGERREQWSHEPMEGAPRGHRRGKT